LNFEEPELLVGF